MVNIVYSLVVWTLFLLISLCGIHYKHADKKEDYFLRLNSFRGIFALEIVIGHVIRYEATLLYPLGKFMIISVAFFFFVSAFGMVKSFHQKEGYLQGFLTGKVLYLVMLAIITFIVNMILDIIYPSDLGYYCPGKNPAAVIVSGTNWYLRELLLFYILFYFVYKYIKKFRILFITLASAVFAGFTFAGGWAQGWYSSILAFPMGLLFGEYYETICRFMKTAWGKFITIILILLGMGSQFLGTDSIIGMVYLRNAMCIAGMLILIYFCTYFTIGNCVNRILIKYSTEIYLFQFIYLKIAEDYGWDFKISLPFVLGCTILTAIIMHPVFGFVRQKLRGVYSQNIAEKQEH
ncbi:MAG: acyltransferase family protein [Lachnospiraceae bacterium]|nr:acyltransferase family protein [Lachnospiraceae bacterium]